MHPIHHHAGVGLKPEHYQDALACNRSGMWFEVHPENYLVDGGPRLAWLDAVRQRHALSLHGVSLSLAADAAPDAAHLQRLAALVARVQPALVSEHLAWSSWDGTCYPDLLPFPRSDAALHRIAANISRTQDALGRTISIENPSHYLRVQGHTWDEVDFLAELARRTGCGLLLDVNNVFVSARNHGFDPRDYLARFPAHAVTEIHLAGHTQDPIHGAALLIDSHDAAIDPQVWALYQGLISRIGPRPTLIERDGNLPGFDVLLAERDRAQQLLQQCPSMPARPELPAAAIVAPFSTPAISATPPSAQAASTSPTSPEPTAQPTLAAFQQSFSQQLLAPALPHQAPPPHWLADLLDQPGFLVYQNTAMKACIDALQAHYPAIHRLVGTEWFRAAAALHVQAAPPQDPRLVHYGDEFAAFLAGFAPAATLPYLVPVAQLERLWTAAHLAADAPVLDAAVLTAMPQSDLGQAVLQLHPSTRWAWFADAPIVSIWQRNRTLEKDISVDADTNRDSYSDSEAELPWIAEGILLSRPHDVVQTVAVGTAECTLLAACRQGLPLAQAAAAALEADPAANLPQVVARLLQAGAFERVA